jgi:hypothetical protein
MYGPRLSNEYIIGLDAFIDFAKKDMVENSRDFICCPCKHCKNEKKYRSDDVLRTYLIKHGFKENYRCCNKHGVVGLNEAEMRDEVPTDGVEEEDDDVNEADILRLSDVNIVSRVDNIEEMVHNVERHADDDQYSNGELAKYKKMIEDSNKPFYNGCAVRYTRLFMMVKLFQLKVSNRWSDDSFKNLLTLFKDMLPQGNSVPETVYEAKQIIWPLGLEVEKIHACKNDCILYRGEGYEDLEKCPICGLD